MVTAENYYKHFCLAEIVQTIILPSIPGRLKSGAFEPGLRVSGSGLPVCENPYAGLSRIDMKMNTGFMSLFIELMFLFIIKLFTLTTELRGVSLSNHTEFRAS